MPTDGPASARSDAAARRGAGGPLRALKATVKRYRKAARSRFTRAFFSFDAALLREGLRDLGVTRGGMLLVHSSYNEFEGFTGKPTDVISILLELLGASGVLMMPTMPFTGTAVDWVAQNPVLDLVRTPSRMGLLTELFRRSSGVARSVHPTHPVAVWGAGMESVVAEHYRSTTPCGRGSPFDRLQQADGQILLLGADISSLTFFHWVEEAIEPMLPVSPFTQQVYSLKTRRTDGSEVATQTRLFEPAVSRRRDLYRLVPELQRAGDWHERRVGRLNATLIQARRVHAAALSLAQRGVFCYA